jgi:hypothetical protein
VLESAVIRLKEGSNLCAGVEQYVDPNGSDVTSLQCSETGMVGLRL